MTGLFTLEQVLEWLPPHIVADFDCPAGPHDWLDAVTAAGNTYRWCRNCTRMRRTETWPDTGRLRHAG